MNVKINGFEYQNQNGTAETKNQGGCKLPDFDFQYGFEANPEEIQEAIKGFYSCIKQALPDYLVAMESKKSRTASELEAVNKVVSEVRDLKYEADRLRKQISDTTLELEKAKSTLKWVPGYQKVKKEKKKEMTLDELEKLCSSDSDKDKNDDPYKEV